MLTSQNVVPLNLWFSHWGVAMSQPYKPCLCPLKGVRAKAGSNVFRRILLLPGRKVLLLTSHSVGLWRWSPGGGSRPFGRAPAPSNNFQKVKMGTPDFVMKIESGWVF